MAKLDYDDTMALFSSLKKSIDTFYSKNSHLEASGVFSMSAILRNCAKMEYFLNSEFEHLWRMEREEARELRQKIESVPVEIVHPPDESEDDLCDDMPPLVKDPFYDMPALVSCKDEPSIIEQNADEAFCEISGDISTAFEVRPASPPTALRTSIWNWAPTAYNPISALAFNQQVRDL